MEVFGFEEDDGDIENYLSDEDSSSSSVEAQPQITQRRVGHGTDLETPLESLQPQTRSLLVTPKRGHGRETGTLSQSVPVRVPPRLATSVQKAAMFYDDDDDEDDVKFEKPHELAAKTYQEQYIKTGLEWDVPHGYTRKRLNTFSGR
eukprot:TRINITY_DN4143_c0_g1_i1.p1 TRINITY_DN4143_c0_g1~~TRINITY_DN4143_c0_g1_i1.p1  ORF type:complete len:147 (-),score=38.36 TRINITY_DN4143_c0_g1_i1:320-760(-)